MDSQRVHRCTSCILPDTGYFAFNEKGECNLCSSAEKEHVAVQPVGARAGTPENVVRKLRQGGRDRPFDCVVGVSGGRDSTYLLYRLRREHNLRCLAAYYRTPFTSETTDANVRRMVKQLDVPLVEMNISTEYHKRVARDFVLLWEKKPHTATANMACAPCKLVNREIFRIARSRQVNAIVCGANRYEAVQIASSIRPDSSLTTSDSGVRELSMATQIRNSMHLINRGLRVLLTSQELLRYLPVGVRASLMYVSPFTPYLRLRYQGIRTYEYFYYSDWDESECENALASLGWELPDGCKSTWKSDCCFAELKDYMFKKMTGMTYLDCFLSNMIRSGIISRDEALERLRLQGEVSETRISEVCEILNLPPEMKSRMLRDMN